MEKLAVIIVTFNGLNWIEKCLKSVINSSIKAKIVIVDNGSTDGTIELIKSKFTFIQLLEQQHNLGFGAANNIGISFALNQGAEYIFLLNQDAYLQQNTIEKLIEIHKNNNLYCVFSPIHLNGIGDNLDKKFAEYIKRNNELLYDALMQNFMQNIYSVPFVNAAGWLVPKSTFNTIGGFDPIFFHDGADDNFCHRLLFHG